MMRLISISLVWVVKKQHSLYSDCKNLIHQEMLVNSTSPYGSPRAGIISGVTTTTPTVQPFYGSPRAVAVRNVSSPLSVSSSNGARNQQRVYGTSPLSGGTKGVKNSSYGQNSHTKLYRGGGGSKGHNKGNKTQRQHH